MAKGKRDATRQECVERIFELEAAILGWFICDNRDTRKALRDLVGGYKAVAEHAEHCALDSK